MAKEAPPPHEVVLTLLDTKLVFQCLRDLEIFAFYLMFAYSDTFGLQI